MECTRSASPSSNYLTGSYNITAWRPLLFFSAISKQLPCLSCMKSLVVPQPAFLVAIFSPITSNFQAAPRHLMRQACPSQTTTRASTMISLSQNPDASSQNHIQAVSEPSSSRVVPKPVPKAQAEDPRRYQIDQLLKRFASKETTFPDGTTSLVFKLVPSDPDFPFELAALRCDVRVPKA